MKTLTRARAALSVGAELSSALARNGRWWLVPLIGVMGVCALLLGVVSVIEYAAPFVYSIF